MIDLEDFDDDHMTAPLQLFAMATYGEGEPTDNAHQFVDWLKGQGFESSMGKGTPCSDWAIASTSTSIRWGNSRINTSRRPVRSACWK